MAAARIEGHPGADGERDPVEATGDESLQTALSICEVLVDFRSQDLQRRFWRPTRRPKCFLNQRVTGSPDHTGVVIDHNLDRHIF